MSSAQQALTAAQYLHMAEELEAMAATIAQGGQVDHHFAERLSLLARQMREDGARLAPPTARAAVAPVQPAS